MRIVIYSHLFAPSVGGVEAQILSMAMGLHGRATGGAGKKVEVIVLTRQLAGDFDDQALPFRVVRNPGLGAILACFRRADIVHLAGPSFLPLLAALALGKRVVVSHHGFQAACPNGQLFYRRA